MFSCLTHVRITSYDFGEFMLKKLFVLSLMVVSQFYVSQVAAQASVRAGDVQGLIAAIENGNMSSEPFYITIIPVIDGSTDAFIFTEPYMNGDSALPPIIGDIIIKPFRFDDDRRYTIEREIDAPQFRLFNVTDGGYLSVEDINIEQFSTTGDGGAVLIEDHARAYFKGVNFRANFASGEGGAIHAKDYAYLQCQQLRTIAPDLSLIYTHGDFINNRSGSFGGAISIQGNAWSTIENQNFVNNNATAFGCDVMINSSRADILTPDLILKNNIFSANCDNVLLENPNGEMLLVNNTITGRGDMADSTSQVDFFGNLIDMIPNSSNKSTAGVETVCNDFGTQAFNSLGYNISNEGSCNLNQNTDLPNTDPMTNLPDANGVISLKAGSPAIDAGAVLMQDNPDGIDFLPCGPVDSRGLGRPQDANGDGVFECDMGSYEVQGGPDITAAQSGLYFDTNRNGEGVHVEMLDNDRALVAMFTYHPNQIDLMWFVGSGSRVGNSIVIDEVYRASGGAFGDAFDADNIENEIVGSLSMVFPNCSATDKPGRMVFQSNKDTDQPMENLLVEAFTLSRLLTCTQNQASEKTGRSGSFFDPQRSGEGIFIDVINDNTAVVFFYTFTPTGEQLWLVGSGASIDGDTINANMLYPTSTTGFGSEFDANEIQFSNWGTLSITHQAGCNGIDVSYNSTVPSYGSGALSQVRLTQPEGVTCDL